MTEDAEADRIRREYARREREIGRDFYALSSPPNLFFRHGQERALQRALASLQALPLRERRLLEVGCGLGQWFATFEAFGARPGHLAGIDLDGARLTETMRKYPHADLRVGNATRLPWPDRSFDLVFQSTMFTSVLDAEVRRSIAREMLRVLAPDGAILWYDFRYDNPRNANVRGIGERELVRLFPNCQIELDRVTLAPPLARRVVPASWLAAQLLERLRVLNTHYFAVIRASSRTHER